MRSRDACRSGPFELDAPTQYWLQLIVRAEQGPSDLVQDFVAQMLIVCKELNVDLHADAVRVEALRPKPAMR